MNLFTRLFGHRDFAEREMDFIDAQRMVLDYARFLESAAPRPGQILDAKRLPHDKQLLRDALLLCIGHSSDDRLQEHLKAGYLMLSAFQHGLGDQDLGTDYAALDLEVDMLDIAHKLERDEEDCSSWRGRVAHELEQLQQELYALELELAQPLRHSA